MNRPPLQIAFFTAQADLRSCALSPVQREFLHRLGATADVVTVANNFPYTSATAPWRRRPMWRESLSVTRQYRASRGPAFAAQHRPAVLTMLAQADETVLLAGSCGLQLVQRLDLPAEAWTRLSFIAYGTVTQSRPPCPGLLVFGRRDWIARGRGPAPDRVVDCTHLDYLENEDFAALCADFVRRRVAAARSHHAAAF